MNGWKLVAPAPARARTAWKTDAAARRHARADGAPRLAAERDVDVPGGHAGVDPGDDVPGERARELVVDAAGGHDDPRARDREADPEAVALVGARAPARPTSAASASPATHEHERDAPPHSGRRVHASERPEATRRSTTPDAGERRRHLALLALRADPAAEVAVHLLQPLGRRARPRTGRRVIRATSRSVSRVGRDRHPLLEPVRERHLDDGLARSESDGVDRAPRACWRLRGGGERRPLARGLLSVGEQQHRRRRSVLRRRLLRRSGPGAQPRRSGRSRRRAPSRSRAGSGRARARAASRSVVGGSTSGGPRREGDDADGVALRARRRGRSRAAASAAASREGCTSVADIERDVSSARITVASTARDGQRRPRPRHADDRARSGRRARGRAAGAS